MSPRNKKNRPPQLTINRPREIATAFNEMMNATTQPAFLSKLQPVDFKAVAEKGHYVYCYLRAQDSKTGKAGSPYYVGLASSGSRPFDKNHSCAVPHIAANVRLMRSGLTWEEAAGWEVRYIAHFGRIDTGSGILRNFTDGGEGTPGLVRSDEDRQKKSIAAKRRYSDPAERAKTAASQVGVHEYRKGKEWREKISARLQGREAWNTGLTVADPRVQAGVERMAAANRERIWTDEERARMSRQALGKAKSAEMRQNLACTKAAPMAAKAGLDIERYLELTDKEQRAIKRRMAHGLSGADLFLPPEIDVRLIKTANVLKLSPLTLFNSSKLEKRQYRRQAAVVAKKLLHSQLLDG